VTLKTLVVFFEIAIPDPWSSTSVASYNELTGIFKKNRTKSSPGAQEESVWHMTYAQ